MWRNIVVKDFVDWLHAHNRKRREAGERQTGFYGLDLYSLHRVDAGSGCVSGKRRSGCGAIEQLVEMQRNTLVVYGRDGER